MKETRSTRLYVSRWVTLSASCFVQLSAGLAYTFSVISPTLKEVLQFRETQIAAIGCAFNLGSYFALPAGYACDTLVNYKRYGPKVVVFIGSSALFIGYFGIYACVSSWTTPTFSKLFFFAFLAGNSSTWYDTEMLITNVRNFPSDRGSVVGILKAFLGLSASVYSSIYLALFCPNTISFLLFIATVPPIATFAISFLVNKVPEEFHDEMNMDASGHAYQPVVQGDSAVDSDAFGLTPNSSPPVKQKDWGAEDSYRVLVRSSDVPTFVDGVAPHATTHHSGWTKKQRFIAIYAVASTIAFYQLCASLYSTFRDPDLQFRRSMTTGLFIVLSFLMIVPFSAGAYIHRRRKRRASGRTGSLSRAPPFASVRTALKRLKTTLQTACLHLITLVPRCGNGSGRMNATMTATEKRSSSAIGSVLPQQIEEAEPLVSASQNSFSQDTEAEAVAQAEGFGFKAQLQSSGGKKPTSWDANDADADAEVNAANYVTTANGDDDDSADADEEDVEDGGAELVDCSPSQTFLQPTFWLLLLQFGVGSGTSLAFINNLGSIVLSLGGQRGSQIALVSLFSVANASGRIVLGELSERLMRQYKTPRAVVLAAASVTLLGGVIWCLVARLSDLYLIAVVIGFSFGAHWCLVPSIASDLFGLTYFGFNYSMLQIGPALGSYLLASKLMGCLYEAAAANQGDGLNCVGPACYRNSWLILAALNAVAAIGSFRLVSATRETYRRLTHATA